MTHVLTLPSGERIHYQLERRQRRTVGLKISATGLIVHAPKRLAQADLERLILSKADWICRKLAVRHENTVPTLQWQDGEQLLLLGQPVLLAVSYDARSRAVIYDSGILRVALPNPQLISAVSRKVIQWYQKQALEDFARRLAIFSAKLGVVTPKFYLSNARTRWGSCNSKQEIRLSWRLLQAPPHIINYVICHELAHLKEMNHSVRFWAVVESIYADYKQAEKDLKSWSPKLHSI